MKKKTLRLLCVLLVLAMALGACGTGSEDTTITTTAAPTTKPTTPTEPQLPQLADITRPLPTLAEKKVTTEPTEGDLILASGGLANATIVYTAGNSKASSAAKDLQNYLNQITGGSFTLVADDQPLPQGNLILVGYTKKTQELGFEAITGYPDGEKYYIGVKENCLVLYGNDDSSYKCTQYAVTRFLEEAGCGWYAEDELWTVVPSCPTLAVKAWELTVTPLFAARKLGWSLPAIYSRWYLPGADISFGHTLWYGEGGLVHVNEYENHPEWFAMIGGERVTPTGWWQYCYTNQELIEYVANKIIAQFNSRPNLMTFSVSANDGWDEGWCDCESCLSKGNRSDQMLYFANEIAKIVCEVHPTKRINFLAYHATFLPPESDIQAHPNVEVMFTMETNPFTDPTLDWVVHEGLNGMTKVTYTQSWMDNVNQWIEQTGLQNSSIWCWLCIGAGSSTWTMAPWVQGNTVTNTFQLYQDMGVDVVFADVTGEKLDVRWPVIYVYARSMWDDYEDAEAILYDACQKLYGEAADEMFLFYRLLADCAAINVDDGGLTWVPPNLFSVYGDYVNEIRAAVAAVRAKLDLLTPEQRQRAEYHLSAWAYAELMM